MQLFRDPQIRSLRWKDTLPLRKSEIAYETTISLPWLGLSLIGWHATSTLHWGFGFPSAIAAFFFFLTGLRQTHNAFHYTLGGPRWVAELTMTGLSAFMLSSMHAVQVAHLRHHKHCLDDHDFEGAAARMSAWQAIISGPLFAIRLHTRSWAIAPARTRRWILVELLLIGSLILWAVLDASFAIRAHVTVMLIGQCLTGFFAVWTVHHDCPRDGVFARTQRGWLKNFVSYDMFYHLEHHLFPAVPTRHLPVIAERLDAMRPELQERQVY